jgi:5,6-dimethylbenzimidazole synthase
MTEINPTTGVAGPPQSRDNDMVGSFDANFRSLLHELIRLRRDVRRFRTDPVPPPLLNEILSAAHQAPSVGLSQPWRFILVESPAARTAVVAEFERCNQAAGAEYGDRRAALYRSLKLAGLREAPVHLLVCSQTEPDQGHRLGRRTQPETARDSTVCAIQNLWLAARAAGIGVGWVSILDPQRLREPLNIAPDWTWVAYLCLGWPVEETDTPELERAGWEHSRQLDQVVHRR